MAERKVHIVRHDQTIPERGIEQRTDTPMSPQDGQEWYNIVDGTKNVYIGGQQKTYAFVGSTEGEVLYSTIVLNVAQLVPAINNGLNNTVFVRVNDYDITTGGYSLITQRTLSVIGETTGQANGNRVRIYIDGSHIVQAVPVITTITNNSSISLTNNSATVTLSSGLWANDLSGQYLFVNGKYYLISSNPTSTQIILAEPYTGPNLSSVSYFATNMIKEVTFENIEFVGKNGVSTGILLQNVINAKFINCRFMHETTGQYLKVNVAYTANTTFTNCSFRNAKIDFINDNYEASIVDCDFKSNVTMGADPVISINTNKGVNSINTNFKITGNTFYGPAPIIQLVSSNQNTIADNIFLEILNPIFSADANSNNNIIVNNAINTQSLSVNTLLINSDYNVIANNIITKLSGNAISLTTSAQNNTVMGNRIIGSAIINDALPATNRNRVEDDLSRLGSVSTGTSKDLIDQINAITGVLQNKPKILIQPNVAVDPSVPNESFVYWNSADNQYEKADASITGRDSAYGMIVNVAGSSGDIQFLGIRQITSVSNPQLALLYNSAYIGQKFYLGVGGTLIPESLVLTHVSGVPSNQKAMGMLVDIVGGVTPEFLLIPTEEYRYGSPSNYWQLGQSNSSAKHLSFGSVLGTVNQIVLDNSNRTFYAVKDGLSGEITQPLHNHNLANSVRFVGQGSIVSSVTSGYISINTHSLFLNGYKYTQPANTITPLVGYSGDVFIYSNTNGLTISTGINDGVLIAIEEQVNGIFNINRSVPISSFGKIERFNSTDYTPASNSYVELERTYVPITHSGSVDVIVTATTQARATMLSSYPHQIANVKLQLNGLDIAGTLRQSSLYFVSSGEISYADMHIDKLVNVYNATSGMVKISLMGRYAYAGSVAPVTFNNTNLRVEL